jgi:hypothetical protein
MRRVTCWESEDGTLHRRRIDAAAQDREIRKNRAGESYLFLLIEEAGLEEDDEDDRERIRRLPARAGVEDGAIVYYYESPRGEPLDRAIARAVRRCEDINRRFGLDCHIDYEAQKRIDGKSAGAGAEGWIDLSDHPTYAKSSVCT